MIDRRGIGNDNHQGKSSCNKFLSRSASSIQRRCTHLGEALVHPELRGGQSLPNPQSPWLLKAQEWVQTNAGIQKNLGEF